MEHTEEAYEYWLACLRPLSDRKKYLLRREYSSARQVYYIEETRLHFLGFLNPADVKTIVQSRKTWEPEEKYRQFLSCRMDMILRFQKRYPKRLAQIASPPYALFVKGRLPKEDAPAVAIVGARQCSGYGEKMALEFGERLSGAGVEIISGMARGIDGAGQRGALNAGGATYAVLGCGADVCYPREHLGLYQDIQERGGILSEYPPGTPPLPTQFPQRNRIISALADVVLVMEAKERSGSLITADAALEQGKDVYALPGPVTSALSSGCNGLIRQGAGILLSPKELLVDMGLEKVSFSEKKDKIEKTLESPANKVYSYLDLCPRGIDSLIQDTGLGPAEVLEQLITLELQGYAREISKNHYVKLK